RNRLVHRFVQPVNIERIASANLWSQVLLDGRHHRLHRFVTPLGNGHALPPSHPAIVRGYLDHHRRPASRPPWRSVEKLKPPAQWIKNRKSLDLLNPDLGCG